MLVLLLSFWGSTAKAWASASRSDFFACSMVCFKHSMSDNKLQKYIQPFMLQGRLIREAKNKKK